MSPVGLVIDSWDSATAREAVDLALAVGLLEMDIHVFLLADGWRHLFPENDAVAGRWRTLVDYCPAVIFCSPWPDSDNLASAKRAVVAAKFLDEAEIRQRMAACRHLIRV